jgi:hypothetical protein
MSAQSSSATRRSTAAAETRSGPDELVPSRYALRVGEIDVMVVSDGVLSLPGAMLGHNVDPAVRAAWLEDMFLPPDVLEWALNVVVVRSGGRTILIDVGIGMEFPDLPRAGKLAQRGGGSAWPKASQSTTIWKRGLPKVPLLLCPRSQLLVISMARTPKAHPIAGNSLANIPTGFSRASVTTCLKKPRRPLPRLLLKPPKCDRH